MALKHINLDFTIKQQRIWNEFNM